MIVESSKALKVRKTPAQVVAIGILSSTWPSSRNDGGREQWKTDGYM